MSDYRPHLSNSVRDFIHRDIEQAARDQGIPTPGAVADSLAVSESRICAWCDEEPVSGRAIYCSTRCRVEASRDRQNPERVKRRTLRAFNLRHRADLMEKALRAIRDTPNQAQLIADSTLRMLDTMKQVRPDILDEAAR